MVHPSTFGAQTYPVREKVSPEPARAAALTAVAVAARITGSAVSPLAPTASAN